VATLVEIARIVKSMNAGAAWLTFDIECDDDEALARVASALRGDLDGLASRLGVAAAQVRLFEIGALHSIKISVPRRHPACGQDERDGRGTPVTAGAASGVVPRST
jgi:Domain of unknown function (DUF4387)